MDQHEWTPEHRQAIDLFESGRNMFVTGSAGTGKTVLLRHLIERSGGGSGVFCTAMTGTAAQLLSGGTTLHKFAGCGLAKAPAQHLIQTMASPSKRRWRAARLLFIDEVSMLDADLFEKLDEIARYARNSPARLWGGVQLVLVGDFLQLPPIGKGSAVRMLFCSPLFEDVAKVKLCKAFRQKEPQLLDLLEAMRYGSLQPQHIQLLQSLDRPLGDTGDAAALQPTRLYALNALVDQENHTRLHSSDCSGDVHAFEATNTGKRDALEQLAKSCSAVQHLELRVNAQVIYLVNSPDEKGLVNGSRGVVTEFDDGGSPRVKFADGHTRTVRPHAWEFRPDPTRPVVTAMIQQLPLKLAWALSVHRAQGMSISHAEIFLDRIFADGHAYVALSRCTSLAGLRVHVSPATIAKITANPAALAFDKSL